MVFQFHIAENKIDVFQNILLFFQRAPEVRERNSGGTGIFHVGIRQVITGKVVVCILRNIRLSVNEKLRQYGKSLYGFYGLVYGFR